MMNKKEYNSYVNFQKKKTADSARRRKWLNDEWDQKVTGFRFIFGKYAHLFRKCEKSLCCGARTGQEVEALRLLGVPVVSGIDLVPCLPYVVEGDIHNLKYEDCTFDLIYTNIYDHSLYPKKFCSEMLRTLKPGGYLLMNFQVTTEGDEYSVTKISDYDQLRKSPIALEVLPYLPDTEVMVNSPIPQNIHAMDWELLVRKIGS